MRSPLDMVREFHKAFHLPHRSAPVGAPFEERIHELRTELHREEFKELVEAIESHDIVAVADALADLTYVLYGTALELGIDLDMVLAEVHRSNMAKLGPDGEPIYREDGKVLKPKGWQPPDIAGVLRV